MKKHDHRFHQVQSTESAVLAGVENGSSRHEAEPLWGLEDSLKELEQLARTAGIEVAAVTRQRLTHPDPATYIGKGKVAELKELLETHEAHTVIFDDELSPGQQRNLEEAFGEETKVLDRTALILDIFAQHAHTREGQIQVELAQYEYRLPRLTRLWTHLIRQAGGRSAGAGGGVGVRGPGETQLESDRRQIRSRIASLKDELEDVRHHRSRHRRQRHRQGLQVVALVGYTNTGKSTLLNSLSRSEVIAENKLFATLDPTTRRVRLPHGRVALFTDTVGFIRKLPHHLVAAFRATLEGIEEADLLLHVADLAHPRADAQVRAVQQVLVDLGLAEKPTVLVWNKADEVDEAMRAEIGRNGGGRSPGSVMISARTGEGLPELLQRVEEELKKEQVYLEVELPYAESELLSTLRRQGTVLFTHHGTTHIRVGAYVSPDLAGRLSAYRDGGNGTGGG